MVPALVPLHAVPPGLLRRAHRRPKPASSPSPLLGLIRLSRSSSSFLLSPSPVFPFCRPLRFIVRNRLQAGLSLFFLVLLVKLSVIPFCELLLRISSYSRSLLLPVRSALHSFFTRFSLVSWTNVERRSYSTNFLSRSRVKKLLIGVKQNKTKNKVHILMAIGISRRL